MAEWSSAPGHLPAIVTGDLALLFAGPHATRAARAVLSHAAPGDGWESVLDLMLRDGLSRLPDFFAGQLDDGALAGVVRGTARLTAAHFDGSTTELSGAELRTWREFRLEKVASFTAHAGADTGLPLAPARPGPLAVSRIGCVMAAASAAPAPVDLARTLEFSDFLEPAPDQQAADAAAASHAPDPAVASVDVPGSGRYDELFGATIHFGVEAAAVRPPEDGDEQSLEEPAAAVSGIVCVAGHPNPLARETCTRCGASLTGAELSRVPRPNLGAVVLPDGRPVPLAGAILIGRSPRVDRTDGDAMPTLVVIDDPDVSRTHVRIVIEGWQVLLEDLGSTNGTVFTARGTGPRRIRPGEAVLVTDGAVADLGPRSRITFTGVP
ncbi:FHA domain-containing protein [Microbacterium jiangjiandongii]|uniref:FHA domain-containing protein n=1 Tax=Microbacterium jiangjiandongii TaxID=3049071 RepID=UPI00214C4449|nr:FHA domain-containing protein [Microbacterium sp. zg.Y843]MCR2816983.1 FHA domain-containing protein [Microbacterium sp. zg.Y843]